MPPWVRRRGEAEVHLQVRSGRPVDRRDEGARVLAYATNYLIDMEHAVIVDVEATRDSPGGGRCRHAR